MFYWGKPQFFGVKAAAANIGTGVGDYTVEQFREDYPQFFNSEGYFLGSLPMLEQIIQMASGWTPGGTPWGCMWPTTPPYP